MKSKSPHKILIFDKVAVDRFFLFDNVKFTALSKGGEEVLCTSY